MIPNETDVLGRQLIEFMKVWTKENAKIICVFVHFKS